MSKPPCRGPMCLSGPAFAASPPALKEGSQEDNIGQTRDQVEEAQKMLLDSTPGSSVG